MPQLKHPGSTRLVPLGQCYNCSAGDEGHCSLPEDIQYLYMVGHPMILQISGSRFLLPQPYSLCYLNHILCVRTPPFHPWEYSPPHIDTSLANGKKSLANPLELRQKFLELRDRLYKDQTEVFTDGSKSDHIVTAAAVANDQFLVC